MAKEQVLHNRGANIHAYSSSSRVDDIQTVLWRISLFVSFSFLTVLQDTPLSELTPESRQRRTIAMIFHDCDGMNG
jgi:hypothetical protein